MPETLEAPPWSAKVAAHSFDLVKDRKPKIKNTKVAARSVLGEDVHVKPPACDARNSIAAPQTVHTAIIMGEVIAVDEQKAVVTFSQDGETELRDFPWSMVKGGKGSLAVGNRVKARNDLELVPSPSRNEMQTANERIQAEAENFARRIKGASAERITEAGQRAEEGKRQE